MTTDSHPLPHQLLLDDRRHLSVSGVSEVDSFDDTLVVAHTALGELTVKGHELHISRLNTETGDLSLEGQVDVLEYNESKPRKGGRLRSWFR